MRDWVRDLAVGLAVVDVVAVWTVAALVATLHRDEQRAARARAVLRTLLASVGVGAAAALRLHQLGVL
jgi:Kef-type K+ transport system membrane component KefB